MSRQTDVQALAQHLASQALALRNGSPEYLDRWSSSVVPGPSQRRIVYERREHRQQLLGCCRETEERITIEITERPSLDGYDDPYREAVGLPSIRNGSSWGWRR